MKRNTLLVAFLACVAIALQAQNDTMYVMKNNVVINKQSVKTTDVDSVIFYKPVLVSNNTVTDARDGKVYKTVKIGTQVWMAENLAYLPQVDAKADGSEDVATGKYYYVYDYTPTGATEVAQVTAAKATANYKTYGVLYNWNAAMNGATSSTTNPSKIQGACPAGWHLPSDAEWTQLTDYLGGATVAGNKLKATTGWPVYAGITNTDEVKFTALPGGYRLNSGTFSSIGYYGFWWSATEDGATLAWYRLMYGSYSDVGSYYGGKVVGFSVRCVRD